MPRGGRRNPPGGRPLGSKNRIPKPKEAATRLNEIVTEVETSNYLHSSEDKKFKGTAAELLQLIYQSETLPVQYRLYAAKAALEFEPRNTAATDAKADPINELLDEVRRRRAVKQAAESGQREVLQRI